MTTSLKRDSQPQNDPPLKIPGKSPNFASQINNETTAMSRNYDLSDPTDLEVLQSDFDMYSADDWQKMIDYTLEEGNKSLLNYDERGALMQARKKALYKNYPSSRQMVWALEVADKVEEHQKEKSK